jgi:secondary thiamine-phosphate synthase enzyme
MAERLHVESSARDELVDITDRVRAVVKKSGVTEGVLHLWSMHTTCALTVNEGFDPDVVSDMMTFMRWLVPQDAGFRHAEGNSDSHIKVAFFGPGLTLLIEDGEVVLGRWQRVFLCEFDGPRPREVACQVVSS